MTEDLKPLAVQTARLVRSETLTPEVTRMEFEVIERSSFDFQPGQYICMMKEHEGKEPEGKVARRYYSIASAPNGTNRFELCIGGSFLAEPEPGVSVGLEGPAGDFLLRDPLRKSVFLAHGTGIAPIRANAAAPFRGRRSSCRTSTDDAPIWRSDAGISILSGRV